MIEAEIHDLPWWRSRLEHLKEQEPTLLRNLWDRNRLKEHLDQKAWDAQMLFQKLKKDGLDESQASERVQADLVSPQGDREESQPLNPQFLSQLDQWQERVTQG